MSEDLPNPAERIIVTSPNDIVQIKQLVLEDAPAYLALIDFDRDHLSQIHAGEWDTTAEKYPTLEAVRQSILEPEPNKFRFGIWDGDIMVGSDNLILKQEGVGVLGSWVGKQYIGHDYAARARQLLLVFAFEQLQLREVYSEVSVGNEASRKSVESSGLVLEGVVDDHWRYSLANPNKDKAHD